MAPVVFTLEETELNRNANEEIGHGKWSRNSRTDAEALNDTIKFTFIVIVIVVRYLLDLARPGTVKLSRKQN